MTTTRKPALKTGTRVMYRGGFGQDAPIAGKITDTGDKKNGMSVYGVEFTLPDGRTDSRWGYREQFEVIPKPARKPSTKPARESLLKAATLLRGDAATMKAQANMAGTRPPYEETSALEDVARWLEAQAGFRAKA